MTTPLRPAIVAVALFLLPASAHAAEATGEGANVAPVKNLPYAARPAPDGPTGGPVLESGPLPVPGGGAARALAAAPSAAPAAAAKAKNKARTPLSCRKARTAKTRKARR